MLQRSLQGFDFVEYPGPRADGIPVVALHGLFGDPENWTPVARSLCRTTRVLALRFPLDGSDRSLDSIQRLSAYVRRFLDVAGLRQVVLCGNSLGGHVAIDCSITLQHRVARLVLTGSAGLLEHSLAGGSFPKNTREFIRAQATQIFFDARHVTDEIVERAHAMLSSRPTVRYLIRVAKATRDDNVRARLSRLTTPTLIVWGADDRITPPHVAEEFHRLIPGSRLTIIPQCGHAPPIERPQQFAAAVDTFLRMPLAEAAPLGRD